MRCETFTSTLMFWHTYVHSSTPCLRLFVPSQRAAYLLKERITKINYAVKPIYKGSSVACPRSTIKGAGTYEDTERFYIQHK